MAKASFIPPMLLERVEMLPNDRDKWSYELKADGFRTIAFKSHNKIHLRSRNDNDFNSRYPAIVQALASMPDETVIDGEVVALDEQGRPSFNLLQNYGNSSAPLVFYVFDVMITAGRDVMREPFTRRTELLQREIVPTLIEPARYLPELDAELPDLINLVKTHGLEGLVAKRGDSRYEPGQRSGVWRKMRINAGQEFVIGGYTVGGNPFDAVVFGYYDGKDLVYAARTRNGFTPVSRAAVFKRFKGLEIPECPFVNLPEARAGRWGQGLTNERMGECRWLKPVLVGRFDYLEWTPDNHLRHTKFVSLRDDVDARKVRREN